MTSPNTWRIQGPADLAAYVPFIKSTYPDNEFVLVGLDGPTNRMGPMVGGKIPCGANRWESTAFSAVSLLTSRPDATKPIPASVAIILCREPEYGQAGVEVADGLEEFHEELAWTCVSLGLRVSESICVSQGRWWSYVCPDNSCCPPSGTPIDTPDYPSAVLARAMAAGLRPAPVPGQAEATSRLLKEPAQYRLMAPALDTTARQLIPKLRDPATRVAERRHITDLLTSAVHACRGGEVTFSAQHTSLLILGLRDRAVGEHALFSHRSPADVTAARRLWSLLCSLCVPPYDDDQATLYSLRAWTALQEDDRQLAIVSATSALQLAPTHRLARIVAAGTAAGVTPEALVSPLRTALAEDRDAEEADSTE